MPEMIHERVAGLDPAEFWQESPTRGQLRAMVLKYEGLAEVAALAAGARGSEYRERLAELSGRWPAALRESELIGLERVAERRTAASSWLEQDPPGAPRSRVQRSLRCWAELHELIRDQLEFRRSLGEGRRGLGEGRHGLGEERPEPATSESFAAWVGERPARARWPGAERLPEVVGAKLRVRAAYLWLAARAGLDLPSLNALLFERAGHWDSRPDDPSWARGLASR